MAATKAQRAAAETKASKNPAYRLGTDLALAGVEQDEEHQRSRQEFLRMETFAVEASYRAQKAGAEHAGVIKSLRASRYDAIWEAGRTAKSLDAFVAMVSGPSPEEAAGRIKDDTLRASDAAKDGAKLLGGIMVRNFFTDDTQQASLAAVYAAAHGPVDQDAPTTGAKLAAQSMHVKEINELAKEYMLLAAGDFGNQNGFGPKEIQAARTLAIEQIDSSAIKLPTIGELFDVATEKTRQQERARAAADAQVELTLLEKKLAEIPRYLDPEKRANFEKGQKLELEARAAVLQKVIAKAKG